MKVLLTLCRKKYQQEDWEVLGASMLPLLVALEELSCERMVMDGCGDF